MCEFFLLEHSPEALEAHSKGEEGQGEQVEQGDLFKADPSGVLRFYESLLPVVQLPI